MAHSDQGIARTGRAEEQPTDKDRAQQASNSDSSRAVSREATRHPGPNDEKDRKTSAESSEGAA